MTQQMPNPLSANFCLNLFLPTSKLKIEDEFFVKNWQLMKKFENSKFTSTDKRMRQRNGALGTNGLRGKDEKTL